MDPMQAPNERVRRLAETLRSNGLAASDSQALEMAKNMAQTDEKVMRQADTNRSSMVKNYDINRPAALERQAAKPASSQQPWEKEEPAQGNPASKQGPAPTNQALDNAISTVQQQFSQPTQRNPELPSGLTLSEAAEEPTPVEEPAPIEAPAAPVEMPVEEPVIEEAPQEPDFPSLEPEAPTAPNEAPAPMPAPAKEPIAPAAPITMPVEEAAPVAAPTVVENPLPAEVPAVQIAPMAEPVAPAAPVQPAPQTTPTPTPVQAPVAAPAAPEEDSQPERTQEMPTTPSQRKDTSHMAESRISLADVFNVNRK